MKRTPLIWVLWTVATVGVGGIVVVIMVYGGPRGFLLIGQTTAGHYQIELACNACHTSIFGGAAAIQKACENCHLEELTLDNDSHPKKKFTDPRNADRLAKLNVIQCVTCHREHQPGITHPMGVTIATDYCFLCHQDLAKDRPTHKNVAFGTCTSAGCHNFHDNRALYEDFLIAHHDEPRMLPVQLSALKLKEVAAHQAEMTGHPGLLPDAPAKFTKDQDVLLGWSLSAHAKAGVNCSGCHTPKDTPPAGIAAVWVEKPGLEFLQELSFRRGEHVLPGPARHAAETRHGREQRRVVRSRNALAHDSGPGAASDACGGRRQAVELRRLPRRP